MTGRRAYEMFTRAFGRGPYYWSDKPSTQFGLDPLVAYDDLTWQEKGCWKALAKQIDQRVARSVAARKASA